MSAHMGSSWAYRLASARKSEPPNSNERTRRTMDRNNNHVGRRCGEAYVRKHPYRVSRETIANWHYRLRKWVINEIRAGRTERIWYTSKSKYSLVTATAVIERESRERH